LPLYSSKPCWNFEKLSSFDIASMVVIFIRKDASYWEMDWGYATQYV
jgi:hypothetical protein